MAIHLISFNEASVSVLTSHPTQIDYPPTVHLIWMGKIIASDVSNQWVEGEPSGWLSHLSIRSYRIAGSPATSILILVGETDEIFEIVVDPVREIDELSRLLNDNSATRRWISGRTLYDGLRAGLNNADIIEILYFDILKRAPDTIGMNDIMYKILSGSSSWEIIRRELILSDEYSRLALFRHDAPGSLFSSYTVMALDAYSEVSINNVAPIDPSSLLGKTPDATIKQLYSVLLGRDVDDDGLKHHLGRLEEVDEPITVIMEVLTSFESVLRKNRLTF